MTIFFQQIVGDNEDDAYKRKHVFVSFACTHTHTARWFKKRALLKNPWSDDNATAASEYTCTGRGTFCTNVDTFKGMLLNGPQWRRLRRISLSCVSAPQTEVGDKRFQTTELFRRRNMFRGNIWRPDQTGPNRRKISCFFAICGECSVPNPGVLTRPVSRKFVRGFEKSISLHSNPAWWPAARWRWWGRNVASMVYVTVFISSQAKLCAKRDGAAMKSSNRTTRMQCSWDLTIAFQQELFSKMLKTQLLTETTEKGFCYATESLERVVFAWKDNFQTKRCRKMLDHCTKRRYTHFKPPA